MTRILVDLPVELWPSRNNEVEGIVVDVHVTPGARVSTGDVLVEVEVEKAVLAIESPVNGTVTRIYVSTGDRVRPGTPLVEIEAGGAN